MRFALQSCGGNVGDSKCNEAIDSSESNIDVNL